jgi:sec-independent protein translocase protein TatC
MVPKKSDEMPFLDHLEELRWRLVWSIGALAVGLVIGAIIVVHFNAILFLEKPILPYLPPGQHLVITHPADSFTVLMSASLAIGGIIALPMIGYQLWSFLSPALYKHEKRVVIPALIAGTLLFACGVALAYYFVLPLALAYLMRLESDALTPMIMASEYFGFVATLCIAFGVVFELPLAISGLTALGLIKPQFLSKYRRHAIVGCWAVAAIITPGDFLGTTFALAIPLYLLFEVSVVLSYLIYKRRERRHRAALADVEGEEGEARA